MKSNGKAQKAQEAQKALVVCSRRYNGHELWTALGILKQSGFGFDVVASSYRILDEVTFQPNKIKYIFDDIEPEAVAKYDALIIVSGNMADTEAHWDHPIVQGYVDVAIKHDLVIGAICCSVPTVRKAAKGKRVSFFPLIRSRERLTNAGAICTTVAVTVDGKLITAEHQMATQVWAEMICKVMRGEEADPKLVDSGYTPGSRPRKPIPEVEALKAALNRKKEREEARDGG